MTRGPWPSEASPQWRCMAREALAESRRMLDAIPPLKRDPGDPNHPNHSGLFGQSTRAFLSRQNKDS